MAIIVAEYIREDGTSPFGEWFGRLDPQARAKVATAMIRLETGNMSSVKWLGVVGEYRIDWGPGYRIYLAKDGNSLVVLLAGGTKKRQSADVEGARRFWSEYKARKAAAARPGPRR